MEKLLTIAVPSYNMENYLPHNLPTYVDSRLAGRLEVIILDNASQDSTAQIAQSFTEQHPQIFTLLQRDSRGYGSSINAALAMAQGKYFRIVDADDWVNTQDLLSLLDKLETCSADVVQTNYCKVVMSTGEKIPIRFKNIVYNKKYTIFAPCQENAPCIHSTVYRTALLRESGFAMQDGIFFVDEEYVILPFIHAKSVVFYDLDIYRYLVGNPAQSTSPENRAKYAGHREQILQRLLEVYCSAQMDENTKSYCFFRIAQAAADHLTTLYMYLPNRSQGRREGLKWERFLQENYPAFYSAARKKGFLLRQLCRVHLSLPAYQRLKKALLK